MRPRVNYDPSFLEPRDTNTIDAIVADWPGLKAAGIAILTAYCAKPGRSKRRLVTNLAKAFQRFTEADEASYGPDLDEFLLRMLLSAGITPPGRLHRSLPAKLRHPAA